MKKQIIPTKSLTDGARIDAMTDEDIDYSDCPEATPEMFARAVVRLRTKPISKKEKSTIQYRQ